MTAPGTGPGRLNDLWLPIGPSTVTEGQAADSPNVTGRVLEVQVSPNGKRVYAATAGGGVWYSNDEGASWLALGAWAATDQPEKLDYFASTLASGSIAVQWDTTANGENDTVFVGTGEITPRRKGTPGGRLAGVGVLRAVNPVQATRTDPFAAVWIREGKALEGRGIYRVAMRPGHPTELLAAASDGLYVRSGPTGPDNWTKVTADPFDDPRVVTDVLWTASHVWVAIDSKGVWRADQPTGPFTEVDLSKLQDGRIGLAVSSDGSIVFALGAGPRLWRITGTTATRVLNVPAALFGAGEDAPGGGEEEEEKGRSAGHPEHELASEVAGNQADYDMVIAVDPDHPEVIVLGGSTVGPSDAALFKCTVQNPGAAEPKLDYNPANDLKKGGDPKKVSPANDPTFIGRGVHPDVHGITFAKRGGNLDLWVTCDGGIYRSTRAGRNFTWQARNNGLAAIEPGYIACHPTSDAVVVLGTQDNGVVERIGDTVSKRTLGGDGGGVACHPAHPERYIGQYVNGSWRSNDHTLTQPVLRSGSDPLPDNEEEENKAEKTSFYSSPGVVAAANTEGARLAIGTNRVWASEDFGFNWFTLPTKSDPRNSDPKKGPVRTDTDQDVFYSGERGKTLACRWKDENELYVLNAESIQRFTRAPLTNIWTRGKPITEQHNKCFDYSESDIKNAFKMPYLPPLGDWSDLAIHVPGPDGSSSLYVACTSLHEKLKMDTLWWYDGSGNWFATKLRDAVRAPALAVVVSPLDPNIVFVGTTLGVWRGTFHPPVGGNNPAWDWSTFSSGLPEAAVQDLAFFREPASGVPTMLLLRAALQSRGAWEVDLLAPCDEKTYLRVHPLDTRRRPTTSLADPMSPGSPLDPFLSPDVLIRPAPPVSPEKAPKPAAAFFPIHKSRHNTCFELWTFQTAFRQLEPACRPTGSWTDTFETLLVEYKKKNGLGAAALINGADWDNVVTEPRVYAQPWEGALPTEADLVQLVMDETHNVQPGLLPSRYHAHRLKVDVLVHHRGLQPLHPPDVSVLLLRRELTEPRATWPTIAIGAPWKAATVTALTTGSPPAGGWPDNWAVAEPTAVRHPAANLDAAQPQAATFDLTFPATAAGRHIVLAVCSSTTATVTAARLAGGTLGDLPLQSSHVAAHVLELR